MLREHDVFAGYVIERPLGRGGMGAVYLARHPRLPRWTALKLLNAELYGDTEIRARFEREAEIAARLNHSGIVTIFDCGAEDEHLWIAMQYVDGPDANSVGTMPPAEAIRVVTATADALDYAHEVGVVHRDVKPANILLARQTREQRAGVLLTDFGIGRLLQETSHLTKTGTVLATLAYASPEQLSNLPVGDRADQYALACTLFRLLTGFGPYPATDTAGIIKAHLYDTPTPSRSLHADLPGALDEIFARALAKQPEDRFHSCTEFAEAAARAFSGRTAPTVRLDPESLPPVARSAPLAADTSSAAVTFTKPVVAPSMRMPAGPILDAAPDAETVARAAGTILRANTAAAEAEAMRERYYRRQRRDRIRSLIAGCVVLVAGLVAGSVWWQAHARPDGDAKDAEAIRAAFPTMLPASGTAGTGYQDADCRTRNAKQDADAYPADLSGWGGAWECGYPNAAGGVSKFVFLAYPSAVECRAAVQRVQAAGGGTDAVRFEERNSGTDVYPNYRMTGKAKTDAPWITSFCESDGRNRFLMYTVGSTAGGLDPVVWWRFAPLGKS